MPYSQDTDGRNSDAGDTRFDDPANEDFAADFTDEELGDLAMAADPNTPVAEDAIPLSLYLSTSAMTLPQWYMPPAMSRIGTKTRTAIVVAIVLALVMIDAFGLCSTYGSVTPA